MLVLTRRCDEEILIGREIKIVVVEIRDGFVRIGIEAPREVPILRPEAKVKVPPRSRGPRSER